MNSEDIVKLRAAQLRKPEGEAGIVMAEWMNLNNRKMNLDAIDFLKLRDHESVLEIGMGNGYFVKDLLNKASEIQYTGCDYSADMIAESKRLNQEYIQQGFANFVLADIANLPWNEPTFTSIFTVNTMYFWEKPLEVLFQLKNILKPDGQLVIVNRSKSVMEKLPVTQYNFRLYAESEVTQLLEEAGFSVVDFEHVKEPDLVVEGNVYSLESQFFRSKILV